MTNFLLWIAILTTFVALCGGGKNQKFKGRLFGDLVRLNPASRVLVGVQITLPLSAFAPNWEIFGRSASSSPSQPPKHNLWSSVRKSKSSLLSCPSQRVELEDYLRLMNIGDEICQQRFICDLSSDPVKFQPLSQILLPKLAYNSHELQLNEDPADIYNSSTYYLMRAAKIGVDPERRCDVEYKACSTGTDSMVNMWMVWGWQLLARYTDIKFLAETDSNHLT